MGGMWVKGGVSFGSDLAHGIMHNMRIVAD